MLLNVNVPRGRRSDVLGVKVTRLGRREYKDELIRRKDLYRLRKQLGDQFALDSLREQVEVSVWKNSYVYYDPDLTTAEHSARIGITVNAVCPGYVETEALAGLAPEQRKAAMGNIPMRRFGRPEEIAAVVRFLACPEASYVTGSAIKVDGGIL